jgi:polar amino acid transport system substrate-binding protein
MFKNFWLILSFSVLICFPCSAREWKEITQSKNFIVGVKDNLRPLAYRDSQGNLQGFEIDIAKRLAQELLGGEDALIFVPLSNEKRLQAVMEDQVDFVIAGISANSFRRRVVDFSPYYFWDNTAIITKKDNLKTTSDLTNTVIILLENSSTISVIKYHLPQAQLIGVKSYQEALSLLESGKADGFAGDLTVLTGWVQEYPQYHLIPSSWSGYPLVIAFPKGLQYQELRQKISELINQWRQDGWLEERAKYWGLL